MSHAALMKDVFVMLDRFCRAKLPSSLMTGYRTLDAVSYTLRYITDWGKSSYRCHGGVAQCGEEVRYYMEQDHG